MIGHAKTIAHRNPHLLAMARGQNCNLQVPTICNRNPETTVAAHSNSAKHGKAGARKADDNYIVFGCSACHSWLDQGGGARNREQGEFYFNRGLVRQCREWARIAYDPLANAKDRAAATWALELLILASEVEGVTA